MVSAKTIVTLSIVGCVRAVGVAAPFFVLLNSTGDKGLFVFAIMFVNVGNLLMLNSFLLKSWEKTLE